jgi:multimeric flavodoxin WrbA
MGKDGGGFGSENTRKSYSYPDTVYVVKQCYAYEGDVLEGVFYEKSDALDFAKNLSANTKFPLSSEYNYRIDQIIIEEWPVK